MGRGKRRGDAAVDHADFRSFAADRLVPLRRLGFLISGDWHLAEDAVSTVLTKLYVAWPEMGRVANLDAYVRTMLVRAIVDERRRPWRRESPVRWHATAAPGSPARPGTGNGARGWSEREAAQITLAPPTDAVDDQLLVRSALARMPARRRAVLVLRYYEGLSVDETAAALGCTSGTVKSQAARGLAALRELVALDGGARSGGARGNEALDGNPRGGDAPGNEALDGNPRGGEALDGGTR